LTPTPRPIPSAVDDRLSSVSPENGVGGPKSGYEVWQPRRFPGVALKTEYSSANRGVQPVDSSSRPVFGFGVSKTGLGKAAETGVRWGVGGWTVESPKLFEGGQR
jgi:hypothetical protein